MKRLYAMKHTFFPAGRHQHRPVGKLIAYRGLHTVSLISRISLGRIFSLPILLVGLYACNTKEPTGTERTVSPFRGMGYLRSIMTPRTVWAREATNDMGSPMSADSSTFKEPRTRKEIEEAIARVQEELDKAYLRHQAELADEREKLEGELEQLKRENEDIRMRYLQLHNQLECGQEENGVPRKKTAIEMYSDTLDLLSKYNKNYDAQDHLPRIVVVGDQSAGKTSVLEMLAQARIFPRGHGEMMTKTPVQVTLSEGLFKTAKFSDGGRQYDLTKENDLKHLRSEIQQRMLNSIGQGRTVSSAPISLHIQGPGLPRVVMVDLPGVIGHMTAGMASDTKDEINGMALKYMDNPNAIIVCVQDGSVDAERSNIADLVSSVDPKGQRTIFVMTKVDMAEAQHTNLNRVRSIMEGRLFKMNALGYFAVVTGRGDPKEDIEDIKIYEKEYFKRSTFIKEKALQPHQTTTDNLSKAVSQEFWKKVRTNVEEQARIIRNELKIKEMEWKNKYKGRLMTRDELLHLGKHEILENISRFNSLTSKDWENLLQDQMWKRLSTHFLRDIYMNIARFAKEDFATSVEVQLSDWAKSDLPVDCVDLTRKMFVDEFERVVKGSVIDITQESNQDVFEPLKTTVVERCKRRHVWATDIATTLRVIQSSSLEDEVVRDEQAWKDAAVFMARKLQVYAMQLDEDCQDIFGPSSWNQWMYWATLSKDQVYNKNIKQELQSFLSSDQQAKGTLDSDDLVTVRINVKKTWGIDVTEEQIKYVYDTLYETRFVRDAIKSADYCKSLYKAPEDQLAKAPNGLSCQDVVMFWKFQEMLRTSAKSLRQQVVIQRDRLEEEATEELELIADDEDNKRRLISGDRVDLAEQIEVTRHISHQLQSFINQLKNIQSTPTIRI